MLSKLILEAMRTNDMLEGFLFIVVVEPTELPVLPELIVVVPFTVAVLAAVIFVASVPVGIPVACRLVLSAFSSVLSPPVTACVAP